MGYEAVRRRLERGRVVRLDGGVGSEVLRRTGRWVRNGIESSADVIRRIHRDYIETGVDVVTTDTFQIAQQTFLDFFHDLEHMRAIGAPGLEDRADELARTAVGYALEAREAAGAEERVAVAGSISPLHHPFRTDLAPDAAEARRKHRRTAGVLADAGVDLILLETMGSLEEARGALEAAVETGRPVWVSLVPDARGRTLAGESLREATRALEDLGSEAVLVNGAPAAHVGAGLRELVAAGEGPVGGYAILGRYAPPSWKMDFYPRFVGWEETSPEEYAALADEWARAGAAVVGGCNGTTPEHIGAMVAMLGDGNEASAEGGNP